MFSVKPQPFKMDPAVDMSPCNMLPDNTKDLKIAADEARSEIRPEMLNEVELPTVLRGHELAPPSRNPEASAQTQTASDLFSPASTNSQSQSSLFSKLPGEIRTQIYKEFLGNEIVKFCPVKGAMKGARGAAAPSPLPLILSCRRIYQESLDILYSSNTWWLLNSTALVLPSYLPPTALSSIRHVVLHYHTTLPSLNAASITKLEWLGTWHTLSRLPNLQTLEVTLYSSDTYQWPAFAAAEPNFLRPLAAITQPKIFKLNLRWPGADNDLGFLPPNVELRREYEKMRVAESLAITMHKTVTDFPHRYCMLGWEEDSKRNPESINECYPLRNVEGQRKGFLRTYRSIPKTVI